MSEGVLPAGGGTAAGGTAAGRVVGGEAAAPGAVDAWPIDIWAGGPSGRRGPWRAIRTVVTVVAVLPFAVPFVWLVVSALKPVGQFYAFPPTLVPDPPSLENLAGAVGLVDVPRLLMNSTVIAGLTVGATVVSASLVGFAFATLPARGRRPLFAVLITTILVPPSATLIPQFILFSRLGWVDSYLPLIVPHLCGSAFFVFLFRQWFRNQPANLFESAELDGANPLQAWWHVALPLARPAIAAVAVFAFVGAWNDFLGPLLYLRSPNSFTISLGLAAFQGTYANQLHFTLALSLVALLPVVAVFAVAQRWIVQGVATGGWRG
ncbi:MAG: carbohydrate ABC transporter permease [Chloroflexi bacterium]|nr:carbohydrate ABC transporter permease [Chloroflexota bacterium]